MTFPVKEVVSVLRAAGPRRRLDLSPRAFEDEVTRIMRCLWVTR